jgi:serine protease Do
MKTQLITTLVLAAFVICLWPAERAGADEVGDVLKKLSKEMRNSLVKVTGKIEMETGTRTVMGTAVCLNSSEGLFMTMALDVRVRPETIKLELNPPGVDAKTFKAKLLGIDPMSGLSFIKAEGSGSWSSVRFLKQSGLSLGDPVFSVGLNLGDPAAELVLGHAYVAGMFRTPQRVITVTGGTLTGVGSVVFDSKGHAVGVITTQPFQRYQMVANNRTVNVPLRNSDRTFTFVPVEEFVDVITKIPSGGKARRLKWIGIGVFKPVRKDLAEAKKIDVPAVMIDQVIPNRPADKAGLKDRDLIVGINGKPLEKLASPGLISRQFARQLFALMGDEVKLRVFTAGAMKDVTVKLEPMPTLPNEARRLFHKGMGLLMREKVMLDKFIEESPTAEIEGLLVVAVAQRGPAARAGLKGGDVVTAVNSNRVTTADKCKEIFDAALTKKPPEPLVMEVKRGTETLSITIRPEAR